jgi:hypothetical protein
MAKSPFSSAGGGSADTSPFSMQRARGGRCKADGGNVMAEAKDGRRSIGKIDGAESKRKRGGSVKAKIEKAEESSDPATRKAAFKAEKKAGY